MPKTGTRQVCKHRCGLSLPVPKFMNILRDVHLVHSIYLETYWQTEKETMSLNFAKEVVKWEVVQVIQVTETVKSTHTSYTTCDFGSGAGLT